MNNTLYLFLIALVFAFTAYFQPSIVSDAINDNYSLCMTNSTIIDDTTGDIRFNKTNVLKCIRNSHTAVNHFKAVLEPKLDSYYLIRWTNTINKVCCKLRDFLLTLIPLMMLLTYSQKVYVVLRGSYFEWQAVTGTFLCSVFLCFVWDILYKQVISMIIREFFITNVSGHIIIIPLILSGLIANLKYLYQNYPSTCNTAGKSDEMRKNETNGDFNENANDNVNNDVTDDPRFCVKINNVGSNINSQLQFIIRYLLNMIVFVCVFIHGLYTCLFFHTFSEVFIGSLISIIIGCVMF